MPHVCTTCSHAALEEIERALEANEPLRRIGDRFGLSASALWRHKRNHILRRSERQELTGRIEKLEQRVARLHRSLVELLVILRRQRRI